MAKGNIPDEVRAYIRQMEPLEEAPSAFACACIGAPPCLASVPNAPCWCALLHLKWESQGSP